MTSINDFHDMTVKRLLGAPIGGEELPINRDFRGYFDQRKMWNFDQKSTFSDFHKRHTTFDRL
jgi:hypothetical protein